MTSPTEHGFRRTPMLEAVGGALAAARIGVWSWERAPASVRWSPEVEAIFGLPPGSFTGHLDDYLTRILPDDLPGVRSLIDSTIARAESEPEAHDARTWFIEHRVVQPDSSVTWVEARGHVELDASGRCSGLTGIIVDVTARKQAEATLRARAEQYRLFTELASDYVYSAEFTPDSAPYTTIVAGSFERTTGYTVETLERAGGWLNIVHPDDRPAMVALAQNLVPGESQINEYRIVDPAGSVRWLRDNVRPIGDAHGRVVRLVGGVTDITQRKRLEAELLQARKLEAIGRLAGAVAHDFNNLLTVILNSAELLVRDHPAFVGNQDIQALLDAAARGGDLTRSLLTIARRHVDIAQPISAADLLLSAQPILSRALGDRIALEIADPDPGLAISIDRGQAHILLLNFAMNARAAMPGGGAFRIAATPLPVEGSRPASLGPGTFVLISVSDTGVGISREVMPYLFEPFFTTRPDGKGTGLGLATCHGIVSAAGGAITVDSQPGHGATFRVYLPAAEPSSIAKRPPLVTEQGGNETVLVVEDGTTLRGLLVRDLRGRGYTVLSAASAEDALSLLAATDSRVDVALLDIGLPGLSGAELALLLRRDRPGTRLVLMSGNPGDDTTQALVASGVAYLQKPFSPRQLGALLRRVLTDPPPAQSV